MNSHAAWRIATIGDDDEIFALLNAASELTNVKWVACFDLNDRQVAGQVAQLSPPTVATDGDWESLLGGDVADLVIVGKWPTTPASATRRIEQLRRLAADGQALVLVHPPCEMLLAYELDMIQTDTRGHLLPYHPSGEQPDLRQLIEALENERHTIGGEPVRWERTVPTSQRSPAQVLNALAADSLILRRMLGQVTSVSAIGATDDNKDWGNLTVQLAGESGRSARWSISGASGAGEVRITRSGAGPPTQLTLASDLSAPHDRDRALVNPGSPSTAAELARAFMRRVNASVREGAPWTGTRWADVCQSLEITDATQRSVTRRRAIELHHEHVTEAETFKSVMAAGGCAMLCWVLGMLLLAGLVEGLHLPIRESPLWRLWSVALVAPLALFLILQFLQLVFAPRPSSHEESSHDR